MKIYTSEDVYLCKIIEIVQKCSGFPEHFSYFRV